MCAVSRLGWRTHCRGLCDGDSIFRNGWKLFLPKCQSGWASSLLAVPALFLDVSSLLEIQHSFQVVMEHGKLSYRLTIPEPKPNRRRLPPCAVSNLSGYASHVEAMSSQMNTFKHNYMCISVTDTITARQCTAHITGTHVESVTNSAADKHKHVRNVCIE